MQTTPHLSVRTGALFRLPNASLAEMPDGLDVGVLGLPFDMGVHPTRVGARGGPQHIRNNSYLVAEQSQTLAIAPLEALNAADFGDLNLVPGDIAQAYPEIESALDLFFQRGIRPLTLGGDGSVTLPILRSARKVFPNLAVLHFDAHTDAYEFEPADSYTNANPFLHAARERLIDSERSFHIGTRSTDFSGGPGQVERATSLGYQLIPAEEFDTATVASIGERIIEAIGDRPVYLSWDMDVFDPSCAPGVTTPSWGGLAVREALALIRALHGLRFVGFEINTVSPMYDHNGQTANLAAQVALECLKLSLTDVLKEQEDH